MVLTEDGLTRTIEYIIVDKKRYELRVTSNRDVVNSAVICRANDGSFLPFVYWHAGVYRADRLLGSTMEVRETITYPHCAMYIVHEGGSFTVRTRKHYEIDFHGVPN